MSTERKNDLDTTALGNTLTDGWTRFKQGQLISYRVMAAILIVATGIGLWMYIRAAKVSERAQEWIGLENATSVSALEEYADKYAGATVGKVARLQAARYLLGPDGIDKLVTNKPDERKKGIENVEKARESFAKLADEFKDDPTLKASCYLGLANAEIALVGISADNSPTSFKGEISKAVEWLDKLAAVAPGTPWGEAALKQAEALKNNPKTKEELRDIQVNLYNMQRMPSLPGGGATPPFGAGLGGMPGHPAIPGFPGGDSFSPITPPTPPAVTPPAVTPVAPAPVAPPKTPPTTATPAPIAPPATPPATPPMTPPNPVAPPAPIAPPATPPKK